MFKIKSDGTPSGTKVYYNGQFVNMVQKVNISISNEGFASAEITILKPEIEMNLPDKHIKVIAEILKNKDVKIEKREKTDIPNKEINPPKYRKVTEVL